MAKKKSSRVRGQRAEREQLHVGFTYGYQWGKYAGVHKELRFPIEGETHVGDHIRIYPVYPADVSKTNPPEYILEMFGSDQVVHWHVSFLNREPRGDAPNADTMERLSVAMDAHLENAEPGKDITPFTLPPTMFSELVPGEKLPNPSKWMSRLVRAWVDGLQTWKDNAEPDSLWWLDTEIRSEEQWNNLRAEQRYETTTYEVRSLDMWGNARDGYEQNNSFRVGTITLRDDGHEGGYGDDDAIVAALRDAGFLNRNVLGPMEAANGLEGPRVQVEDNGDAFIEIADPDEPIVTPVFNWDDHFEVPAKHGALVDYPAFWEWAWDSTIDRTFGDDSHDDSAPPNIEEVRGYLRDHARLMLAEVALVEDETFQVVEAAVAAAIAAHRDSTGGIPILQLERIEDENN